MLEQRIGANTERSTVRRWTRPFSVAPRQECQPHKSIHRHRDLGIKVSRRLQFAQEILETALSREPQFCRDLATLCPLMDYRARLGKNQARTPGRLNKAKE